MKWEKDPIVEARPKWQGDAIVEGDPNQHPSAPAFELPTGRLPELLQPSQNPNSAGTYPIGRKYTVGDEARFRILDLYTGATRRDFSRRVTRVDVGANRVEFNDGFVSDEVGNYVAASLAGRLLLSPKLVIPAELQVGRRWSTTYRYTTSIGGDETAALSLKIVRREPITVPAGTFHAFRIEAVGGSFAEEIEETFWLMPYLNFSIRADRIWTAKLGRARQIHTTLDRVELVSLKQWTFRR